MATNFPPRRQINLQPDAFPFYLLCDQCLTSNRYLITQRLLPMPQIVSPLVRFLSSLLTTLVLHLRLDAGPHLILGTLSDFASLIPILLFTPMLPARMKSRSLVPR